MLETVNPRKACEKASTAEFSKVGLEIWITHADRHDWTIGATMDEESGIVFAGLAHEHFWADEDRLSERLWTTQMVDFIAEALTGDIEIRTTMRGAKPIIVEHFRVESDGTRTSLGHTGFLTPRRAMVWLSKSSSSERVSFS